MENEFKTRRGTLSPKEKLALSTLFQYITIHCFEKKLHIQELRSFSQEREGLIQRLVRYGIIETAFLTKEASKQHEQFAKKREGTKELSNLMMFSSPMPQDNKAQRFPVSVKGIVYHDGRVVLLKNERDEWELPGGKLELGETPEACVVREIEEELGLVVRIGPLLDSWVYHIFEGVDVLILTYGSYPTPFAEITHSPEHKAVGLFSPEEVPSLRMPEGYKKSIQTWIGSFSSSQTQ